MSPARVSAIVLPTLRVSRRASSGPRRWVADCPSSGQDARGLEDGELRAAHSATAGGAHPEAFETHPSFPFHSNTEVACSIGRARHATKSPRTDPRQLAVQGVGWSGRAGYRNRAAGKQSGPCQMPEASVHQRVTARQSGTRAPLPRSQPTGAALTESPVAEMAGRRQWAWRQSCWARDRLFSARSSPCSAASAIRLSRR